MRQLLDAIYRWLHDPRYLGFWGICAPADEKPADEKPADEKPQGDIYYTADYERDLKHEDGREQDENWIQRIRDAEDRFLGR